MRLSALFERFAEVLDDLTLYVCHRHLVSQFAFEARHPVLADAAGCDTVEPSEVGLDVEREAVGGDPTRRELHAYGGDLALPHPHPRVLRVVPSFEPIVLEHTDEHLLKPPQVLVG